MELKDGKEFEPVLEKIVTRISELSADLAPEKKSLGGTTYYRVNVPAPPNYREGDPLPEPTFAIVHGYLMVSDREAFLKNIIAGNAESSLADELDFKLIANKAMRAVGESKPGLLGFNRPEEGLRISTIWPTPNNPGSELRRQARITSFSVRSAACSSATRCLRFPRWKSTWRLPARQ